MSRHEGVSCDSCLKSNFSGRRYKCLICYDYDLCGDCYEEGATSTRHLLDHPMQCILTRADMEIFYGGEVVNTEQQQSFTCPLCGKMGFSECSLLDHVISDHAETVLEVVCPICAGSPGGEPNLVTDDFAGHLTLEHRQGPRELISFLDEPNVIRNNNGVRRVPGRALGAPRTRRSNLNFGSSNGVSSVPSPGRETVDPIAELLSQLSGVRRGGLQPSQLQQLQMQIQLERQQISANRQQIDRLPRRPPQNGTGPSTSPPTMAEMLSSSNITMPIIPGSPPSNNSSFGPEEGGVLTGEPAVAGGPAVTGVNIIPSSSVVAASSSSISTNVNGGSPGRNNDWTLTSSPNPQPSFNPGGVSTRDAQGNYGFNFPAPTSSHFNNTLGMLICSRAASSAGLLGNTSINCNSRASGDSSILSHSGESQSNFLLSQFKQPAMSDPELSRMDRDSADRSQFVQSLLLSFLSVGTLPTKNLSGEHSLVENKKNDDEKKEEELS